MGKQDIDIGYGRTSKEKDDAYSVDTQINEINAYVARQGWPELPLQYQLREDFSGYTLDRPEFNKLRALIKEGRVRRIIIHHVDRLSRRSYHAKMILEEEILANNIELHIVAWGRAVQNTPEDIAFFGIQADFAQLERSRIKIRMTGAKQTIRDAGGWVGEGKDRYGYTRVGKRKERVWVIVKEERAIIERVFYLYVIKDWSVADIVAEMNKLGYATPGQAKGQKRCRTTWTAPMIYAILNCRHYLGYWMSMGEERHFPDRRIITDEMFQRAQEKLMERAQRLGISRDFRSSERKEFYLLRHEVYCDECRKRKPENQGVPHDQWVDWFKCSASTTRQTRADGNKKAYRYYRCNSRHEKREDREWCNLHGNADRIDELAWEWCQWLLNDPDKVAAAFEGAREEAMRQNQDTIESIAAGEATVTKLREKRKRYMEMFADGIITSRQELAEMLAPVDETLTSTEDLVRLDKQRLERAPSSAEVRERVTALVELRERLELIGFLDQELQRKVVELLGLKAYVGVDESTKLQYVEFVWHGAMYGRMPLHDDEADLDDEDKESSTCDGVGHLQMPVTPERVWKAINGK
ncbi:MAG: recombinase family protein [Chloroflexales bacterium]|nr:recombinase family protein [Chloroflexales bacterium]